MRHISLISMNEVIDTLDRMTEQLDQIEELTADMGADLLRYCPKCGARTEVLETVSDWSVGGEHMQRTVSVVVCPDCGLELDTE